MLRILSRTNRASILALVGVRFEMIINTLLSCRWSRPILYQHVCLCEVVRLEVAKNQVKYLVQFNPTLAASLTRILRAKNDVHLDQDTISGPGFRQH
jgi:hypothetical protein